MVDIALLHALADAGATAHQIIAAIEANQKLEAEKRAAKREQGRQRQKTFRARNADVVPQGVTSEKSNENNDRVTLCNATPLESPIKNLPSEEESKILDFAGARPEEKEFGYSSSDGSISFNGAEISRLSLDCYTLTNVYGQIRNLAESSWVTGMRPLDRKRAIVNKIKKLHRDRVNRFAPDKAEQQQAARQSIDAQQEDLERARRVRERLSGGRNAGSGSG